jgi:DNA-binding HxlR family transcriptional regulator
MQKYKQYCPVARASEILADRWTPLIVRELILGSHRFNEIERGLPGISRSLLVSRLRDLEDAGVVERLPRAHSKTTGYHLTEAGRDRTADRPPDSPHLAAEQIDAQRRIGDRVPLEWREFAHPHSSRRHPIPNARG